MVTDMTTVRQVWIAVLMLSLFLAVSSCARLRPVDAPPPYIHLSGGVTTGPLVLRRIELQFPNQRGEITVPLHSQLTARAIVQFNGNGLFRADWVVDGRVIETISLMVTYGDTLTIDTAPTTVLPTLEPGPHELTLRIEQPAPSLTVPLIRYWVSTDEDEDLGSVAQ
jgi:hypothetical protein